MDTWLASVFGYHKEYHEHEVQVSPKVPVFSPLGYTPRSGVAGSHDNSVFTL